MIRRLRFPISRASPQRAHWRPRQPCRQRRLSVRAVRPRRAGSLPRYPIFPQLVGFSFYASLWYIGDDKVGIGRRYLPLRIARYSPKAAYCGSRLSTGARGCQAFFLIKILLFTVCTISHPLFRYLSSSLSLTSLLRNSPASSSFLSFCGSIFSFLISLS